MKEKKIEELQVYEQNLQNLVLQKQIIQAEFTDITSALKELEKSKEEKVYRIVGGILIKEDKTEIKKDLEEKKKLMELRLKSFEKQEEAIKKRIEEIRAEVLKEIK